MYKHGGISTVGYKFEFKFKFNDVRGVAVIYSMFPEVNNKFLFGIVSSLIVIIKLLFFFFVTLFFISDNLITKQHTFSCCCYS